VDYAGAVQSIVTSSASNDGGMFETNLRDDRFLPFEGAGAESTWKLDLADPKGYPAFDYSTLSDVILHLRYTARQGADAGKVKASLDDLFQEAAGAGLALLFSLSHDFPTEWSAFLNSADAPFSATIRRDYFPYFTQGKPITVTSVELFGNSPARHHATGNPDDFTTDVADPSRLAFTVSAPVDAPGPTQVLVRSRADPPFLVVRYTIG
jgi:hypothetical protein